MRIVVTGAAGFIGTTLTRILADAGHEVVGVDLGERPAGFAGTRYHRMDVTDEVAAREAVRGAQGICHLAAESGIIPSIEEPLVTARTNVMGTITMLWAAWKESVPSLALASSCATQTHLRTGSLSPYAASKQSGETYLTAFRETYGLKTAALRLSNVYGPGSAHKSSAVARMLRMGLESGRLEVTGDGGQRRDFLFVEDAAHAFRQVMEQGAQGEFTVSTGVNTSVLELAEIIRSRLGLGPDAIVHTAAVPGDTRDLHLDPAETARTLGWHPRVSLAQGLEITLEWFRGRVAGSPRFPAG